MRKNNKTEPEYLPPNRLLNKNFFLLWQGQFISRLGGQVYAVAMILWIKHATESGSLIGLIMMISSLPGVLLSWLGGTFADRNSRRKIILISDIFRGFLVLSLVFLFYFIPDQTTTIISYFMFVAVFMSVTSSFFVPAISASIPELVPKEKIGRANSLRQLTSQISLFIGQGLGAMLYRLLGAPVLIIVNSLSFFISAFFESFIKIPQKIKPKEKDINWKDQLKSFRDDFIEGFRYVWSTIGLRNLFFFSAIFNFFTMPIVVLLPFYVEDFLKVRLDWYGYLLAIYGGGILMGSLASGFIKFKVNTHARIMITFAIINSALVGGLGLAQSIVHAIILAFLVGFMGGFNGVSIATILQITTPNNMRGRVFGLIGTLSGSLAPLGMGLGGIVFDLTGKNIPLIFLSCSAIMVVLSVIISSNKNFREFLKFDRHISEIKISPDQELIKLATENLNNGLYHRVIRLLNRALSNDPDNPEVLYLLGLTYFEMDSFDEATWYLNRLLTFEPDNFAGLNLMAAIYYQTKRHERAEDLLKKMIERDPNHQTGLINLAVIYRNQKRFEESNQLFTKFAGLYPNDPRGYLGLAQNYYVLKDDDAVRKNLKQVKQLDKNGMTDNDYLKIKLFSRKIEKEHDFLEDNRFNLISSTFPLREMS